MTSHGPRRVAHAGSEGPGLALLLVQLPWGAVAVHANMQLCGCPHNERLDDQGQNPAASL
jgi:hypothetical protein